MKVDQAVALTLAVIGILVIAFVFIGYGSQKPVSKELYEYQVKITDYKGSIPQNLTVVLAGHNRTFKAHFVNKTGVYSVLVNASGDYELRVISQENITLLKKTVTINVNTTEDVKLDAQPVKFMLNVNRSGTVEPIKYDFQVAIFGEDGKKLMTIEPKKPGEPATASLLPFGKYRFRAYWVKVLVAEGQIEVNGSTEVYTYTVPGKRVSIEVWNQHGEPLLDANVKVYYNGVRVLFGRTFKKNWVNATLPLKRYAIAVELYGVNTTVLNGSTMDLTQLKGEVFNVTAAAVNATLKFVYQGNGPATDVSLRIRGLEGIFAGKPGLNATVNLTGLPADGDIYVMAYRGKALAINKTLHIPLLLSGTYNYTVVIPRVTASFQLLGAEGAPAEGKSYLLDMLTRRPVGSAASSSFSFDVAPGEYRLLVFLRDPSGEYVLARTMDLTVEYGGENEFKVSVPTGYAINLRLPGPADVKLYYLKDGHRILVDSRSGGGELSFTGLMKGSYVLEVVQGSSTIYRAVDISGSSVTVSIAPPPAITEYTLSIVRLVILLVLLVASAYLFIRLYRRRMGASR